ncbi:hypothetical protein [Peribacillus frigoritolerans]|uniref:hypothetical protein n=1 Tax=Peribacillus frigoritolerans TaxID=450367 RepID=UPI003305DC15
MLFDFRAWVNSEGNMTTLGYYEKNDMQGAVDWVNRFSMGGATALLAAAEEECVGTVIADSPFSDLRSYFLRVCFNSQSFLNTHLRQLFFGYYLLFLV